MAATSDLNRVSAIVLRYMRTPFLVLLATYAVGITGMALVPGQETADGYERMNLYHAFYFFTYSATTTGFGEIPKAFSEAQRMWATVCLYIGVIAWLYAIGSFIRLVQHPDLLTALAERRFARSVRRISEPFFIICGFGDTGSLLARGLSENFCAAVIIDSDIERIKALSLRDYRVSMPGLCADASVPKHLIEAGVGRSQCLAVVTLTPSEDTNLKIAVMARTLNPSVRIVCRSTSLQSREYLETVGDVAIVDPYEIFARQLRTAICTPLVYAWEDWLVGALGTDLEKPPKAPRGKWVLCGYGRMGKAVSAALGERGIETVAVDPYQFPQDSNLQKVTGRASTSTLKEAGIADAVGIVAGTDCDEDNLGILLSTHKLNPGIFSVVRQNHHENELAFNGASASLIMQPSLITARRILLTLTAPLFLDLRIYLRGEGRDRVKDIVARTEEIFTNVRPRLWTLTLENIDCALSHLHQRGIRPTLGDALRSPIDRKQRLEALVLVIHRAGRKIMLPGDSVELMEEDTLLYCGTNRGNRLIRANLQSSYTLYYLHQGTEEPRSLFASWLASRQSGPGNMDTGR